MALPESYHLDFGLNAVGPPAGMAHVAGVPGFRFFRYYGSPTDPSVGVNLGYPSTAVCGDNPNLHPHGVTFGEPRNDGGHLAVPGVIIRIQLGAAVPNGSLLKSDFQGRAMPAASRAEACAVALEAGSAGAVIWAVFER